MRVPVQRMWSAEGGRGKLPNHRLGRRFARHGRRRNFLRLGFEILEDRRLLANWSGDIPDGTIWPTGEVQVITGAARVPPGAMLTIQAGAIIKLSGILTDLNVEGKLDARGTASAPIIFTSYVDDSAGGDTNGNGPSAGSRGNGSALRFEVGSAESVVDHAEFRYGGYQAGTSVRVERAELIMSNSLVRESSSTGIRIVHADPTLTNNTFQAVAGPAAGK